MKKLFFVALALSLAYTARAADNLTGHWLFKTETNGAVRETSLYLKAEGDLLTGYLFSRGENAALEDGKVSGDSIAFSTERDQFGEIQKLKFAGKVTGETLALQMPGREDRPGPVVNLSRVSREVPPPIPQPAPKASLPAAPPIPANGLAQTPPMGWNSWNKFAAKVSDQLIRETADAMASNGMKDAGYNYINIDDTWEAGRDAQGKIQTNEKFPDMKALADYVHSKGLKLGIYSSPGPKTCANYEGSFQHEEEDAKTYAAWGIDYLKYDWCSGSRVYDYHSMPAIYAKMGAALRNTGRPIVFSLCQYGVFHGAQWGASAGGNLWRTTGDISDNWKSMSHIGFDLQLDLAQYAGPGHWNDPDMLEVGNGGMTETEYRTHMSLWALQAAPLLAGNDLRSVSPSILAMLTNKDVIAIDQDKLGRQATRASKDGDLEVWARPLSDGSQAVGLFNRGSEAAKVTAQWLDLKVNGAQTVHDMWANADRGKADESYSAEVPSHGVVLLRITPAP